MNAKQGLEMGVQEPALVISSFVCSALHSVLLLFVCVKLGCVTSRQSSRNELVYRAFHRPAAIFYEHGEFLPQQWPYVKVSSNSIDV